MEDSPSGLEQESTVLLEQVRTIDRTRLKEYIGRAGRATMRDVDHAIAVSFGLDGILFHQEEPETQAGKGEIRTPADGCRGTERGRLMESRKRAWAYCSIDAPEDENEALKKQRQQLMEYAEQMGFEVMGSSSDAGRKPLWERSGFKRFVDTATHGEVDILLVASRRCLTHSSMQMAQLQELAKERRIRVYSP